jgi:quercetin dioxygenase-like cupin family protein
VHREPHIHEWDARLFVLEGALTLVRGNGRETFGPGDSCSLAANTPHEEHTGADGVRYVAGSRPRAVALWRSTSSRWPIDPSWPGRGRMAAR